MVSDILVISSNIIFYLCLLYIWTYFIVRVMGETGIDIVLILSTVGIVLSLLGYIFEFLFN